MKPLTRQEFAIALKKGQGRALQHITHFGMGDFKDLVLEACLQNQNFDAQIDSSRAPWLFSMFQNTSFYEQFREAIFNRLDTSSSWDLFQTCNLLGEMALIGDSIARQRLKEVVFKYAAKNSEDEHIVVYTFVDLQTTDEFLELARIFGNRLIQDQAAFPFDWLIPEEKKQEFKELLDQSAQNDLAIQKYRQYLDEQGSYADAPKSLDLDAIKKKRHERARQKYTLEQTLNDAQNKKWSYPGRYLIFGKHATKEELDTVFASLMSEHDPEVQLRLLWVFRRAALPEINDAILRLAYSLDQRLRTAAVIALSEVQDEKVHQLAKEKIKRGELVDGDSEVIGLFHHNYEKSDAPLITSTLCTIKADEHDLHSLGFDLIDLSEIQSDSNLSDALKWVYEHTPCMNCRYQALLELNRYHQLDERIAQELPFDADPDIRDLAGG